MINFLAFRFHVSFRAGSECVALVDFIDNYAERQQGRR